MYTFKGWTAHLFMRFFEIFPLKNKIVFSSFNGRNFGDNPRAIYEKLLEKNISAKYIWLMEDKKCNIPKAIVVKPKSLKALYHLSTSKIWIDNIRKSEWTAKRKNQYYIQTWHGGICKLKKIEKDAEDNLSMQYVVGAKNDSKMINLFISNSSWNSKKIKEAFWYDGEILECGSPKSDVFFNNTFEAEKNVEKFYKINSDEKIILYAPTFREKRSVDYYNINFELLLKSLKKKWGGSWKIIVRLHPHMQNLQNHIKYDDFILNGSIYPEINDLIIKCDFLITDYSSCMFDAMEMKKKIILYTPDLDLYKTERGTYFKLEELPFLLAKNNEELISLIYSFDIEGYEKSITSFLELCGSFNKGYSSDIVVKKIENILNEKIDSAI